MKKTLLALLALHVLRLLFAPAFELAPQEAYYFLYAQHPSLGYFDHPPAVAWLIWPFAQVLGRSELAPRLAAWLATLGTFLTFAALARRTLPRARQGWALGVFGTTLMASLLSLIATPDVPLLLLWGLALLFLHRALFGGRKWDWLVAGLWMGLAFDAKYTAVFLQLGLLLFLLLSVRHRRWLATAWPYLCVGVAHLAMSPVYLWNATHGWASFLFQSAGRASNVGGLGLVNLGKLLGTQSVLLLPPLLLAMAWAAVRVIPVAIERDRRSSRATLLFLACFAVPLIALFGALSLFALVKPNWLWPAYLSGTLLALRLVPQRGVWKAQVVLALAVLALAAVEVGSYPVPVRSDDTWYGWRELAREAERRAQTAGVHFLLADDEYKTTAELRFYSELPAYAGNVLGRRALQFDYLGEDLFALVGKDALFLDSRPRDETPGRAGTVPEAVASRFESVEEQDPILIRRGERIVRKFLVYRCRSYSGVAGK
ncbi:MAG: glycosyltransferase family 39 protein [Deltaproteobacteria bacterium]|nr:glycosyltransferase family 39 protein [Deltaproteobacteria bacterium]